MITQFPTKPVKRKRRLKTGDAVPIHLSSLGGAKLIG
jgi:hypothetical protein